MSEYDKEFKTGDVKRLDFGSKQADMLRKAAKKKNKKPNDYVKASILYKAQECK